MQITRSTACLLLALLGAQAGCKAEFIDDRPAGAGLTGAAPAFDDQPEDLRGADLSGLKIGTLAQGSFTGRGGHLGVGGTSLVRQEDGHVQLLFDDLFQVSQLEGLEVVLTSRDAIGTAVDPDAGDLPLDPLRNYAGAQSYVVPGGGGARHYVFVYCQPYGLEVARATLMDVP